MGAKRLYPGISNNQLVKIIVTKKSYDALYIVKVKEISNIKNKNHHKEYIVSKQKFYDLRINYNSIEFKYVRKITCSINSQLQLNSNSKEIYRPLTRPA